MRLLPRLLTALLTACLIPLLAACLSDSLAQAPAASPAGAGAGGQPELATRQPAYLALALNADSAAPAPTRTPFRPLPITPTPSPTPLPTATPLPTPSPTPIPAQAYINNLYGYPQAYTLSCESRSASDWARYFGFSLSENEILFGLPASDNPEVGFVGNVNGWWGQIPPNPYGVHAAPVARLLRAHGVPAQERYGLGWEELQAEIAAGRPVMTWVIGQVGSGSSQVYQAQDGSTTVVARFEHTVIVIGYTQDSVTVLDNHLIYTRSLGQFLDSWGVLGNMAIVYEE